MRYIYAKSLYPILLSLAVLLLFITCHEENTPDSSILQSFDEYGRETLLLTADQAKLYYYTFNQPNSKTPPILR